MGFPPLCCLWIIAETNAAVVSLAQAVSQALLSAPQVAVLAPTWPLQVTGQDIRATLGHLPQHLDLAQLFGASQVRLWGLAGGWEGSEVTATCIHVVPYMLDGSR
jgi:hypothetical protein